MVEPVLFLAFANQAENPLPKLSQEDNVVYETLHSIKDHDEYTFHRDQNTSASEIIKWLGEFQNRVSIFHFGGHAASAQLYLVDQPVEGKGLIQLLASQKPLRLVFLNGCNTSGFIKQLLASGVPAIVATSRSVEDTIAVELATHFYKRLSSGDSVGEAFAFAKNALELNGSVKSDFIAVRGVRLLEASHAEFPWGLYSTNPKALDWRLKDAISDINPAPPIWRIAVAICLIFGLFVWGIIHIGVQNLFFYLILGPLAVIIIALVIVIGLSFKNKRTQWKFQKWLYSFTNTLMKPIGLTLLCALLISLFMLFSSVHIDHPSNGPLNASLMSAERQPVWHRQIDRKNQDQTRLVTRINPFSRTHLLNVTGYSELPVHYDLFAGAQIPVDSLRAHPAVIARLPIHLVDFRSQMRLEVIRKGKQINYAFSDTSGSVKLGNPKAAIPQKFIAEWSDKMTRMILNEDPAADPDLIQVAIDRILNLWIKTTQDNNPTPINYGDTLTIRLVQVDPQDSSRQIERFSRQIEIKKNEIITDVLLN